MKRIFSSALWFLPALLLCTGLTAQTTYQMITKKVEQTFPYHDGYEVNIEGEKAEVVIETWDRKEVQVIIALSAKHPRQQRAETDLRAMQYQTERVNNQIYIRNYLSVPEGAPKPESLFDTRYTIRLPEECPVYLKNSYGVASVSNLVNRLRVNSAFTKLGLDNIQGLIDVRTRFGDLEGSRLDGTVTINSRRSNITLREIRGQFDISAQYGILEIFADQDLIDLKIDAENSDVSLYNPKLGLFTYNIRARDSDLRLPNELEFRLFEEAVGIKRATFKPEQEYSANVTITIRFGELRLQKH